VFHSKVYAIGLCLVGLVGCESHEKTFFADQSSTSAADQRPAVDNAKGERLATSECKPTPAVGKGVEPKSAKGANPNDPCAPKMPTKGHSNDPHQSDKKDPSQSSLPPKTNMPEACTGACVGTNADAPANPLNPGSGPEGQGTMGSVGGGQPGGGSQPGTGSSTSEGSPPGSTPGSTPGTGTTPGSNDQSGSSNEHSVDENLPDYPPIT